MTPLLRFAFPGGFVLAAAVVVLEPLAGSRWMASLGPLFACTIWGLGALLALMFKQVRAVLLQAGFILLWVALAAMGSDTGTLLHRSLLVVLPALAAVLIFLPQQGLLNPSKGVLLVLFALVPVDLALVLTTRPDWAAMVLDWGPLLFAQHLLAGVLLWLPPLALAAWRWRRKGDTLDAGLFWAFASLWLGLFVAPRQEAVRLAWLAGGIILIFAVLEKAYRFAYRDELTQVPSRRAMAEQMETLRGQFAAAMVDIDHFKAINDTYGHGVGDQVLRKVASQVADVKGGGRVFRCGGEEFAVLFPGKTRREAASHMQAVLNAVGKDPFVLRHWTRPSKKPERPAKPRKPASENITVTVSIGVAESGGALTSPQEVLQAADAALYRAKKSGRNCLVTG